MLQICITICLFSKDMVFMTAEIILSFIKPRNFDTAVIYSVFYSNIDKDCQ